jgi:hypothetical protein
MTSVINNYEIPDQIKSMLKNIINSVKNNFQ